MSEVSGHHLALARARRPGSVGLHSHMFRQSCPRGAHAGGDDDRSCASSAGTPVRCSTDAVPHAVSRSRCRSGVPVGGLAVVPAESSKVGGYRASERRSEPHCAKGLTDTTDGAHAAASSVTTALSRAGRSIAEHMPLTGNEASVESLIQQARAAAEEAREGETRAVGLAQEARAAAEEASRAIEVARERARQAEADAKAHAVDRVDKVRTETTARVAVVKSEADERVRRRDARPTNGSPTSAGKRSSRRTR